MTDPASAAAPPARSESRLTADSAIMAFSAAEKRFLSRKAVQYANPAAASAAAMPAGRSLPASCMAAASRP